MFFENTSIFARNVIQHRSQDGRGKGGLAQCWHVYISDIGAGRLPRRRISSKNGRTDGMMSAEEIDACTTQGGGKTDLCSATDGAGTSAAHNWGLCPRKQMKKGVWDRKTRERTLSRGRRPIVSPCRVVRFSIDCDGDQSGRDTGERGIRGIRGTMWTQNDLDVVKKGNQKSERRRTGQGRWWWSVRKDKENGQLQFNINNNNRGYPLTDRTPTSCDLPVFKFRVLAFPLELDYNGKNYH